MARGVWKLYFNQPSAPLAEIFCTTVFHRPPSSITLLRSSGPMPLSLDNIWGKVILLLRIGMFFFHRRSDEMISSSASRQCPANRRRLRLRVSEIGGIKIPINYFLCTRGVRSSGYFAPYGGGLYKFHPVVSHFSVLVSRFLIRREEWALFCY